MKRQFSKFAVERRATRRSQDKADDDFYFEQARKRREAEEVAAAGASPALPSVENDHSEDGHVD
jgi:hypothetical protein